MKKNIWIALAILFFIFIVSEFFLYFLKNNCISFLNFSEKCAQPLEQDIFQCHNDFDCLPEQPLLGIKYICQNNQCLKKPLQNPASVYCQKENGILEERTDPKGIKYNVCIFPDKTECEEWKFFQKKCYPGDFNPKDDIWEGKIISLQRAQYDDYFEMLNGDKIGIDSSEEEIKNMLTALRDKEGTIKVFGKIITASDDVGGKKIMVQKILDFGEITFTPATQEESFKIAQQTIEKYKYCLNNKSTIKLVKTIKEQSPYSWTFVFSCSNKNDEKKFKVTVKEKKAGDVIPETENLKTENLHDCSEFALVKTCNNEYNPVCGKIQKNIPGIEEGNYEIKWKNFSNPCLACSYSGRNETILGYKTGKCPN